MRNALRRIATVALGGAALGGGFMVALYKSVGSSPEEPESFFELTGFAAMGAAMGAAVVGAGASIAEIGKFSRWVPWRQRS